MEGIITKLFSISTMKLIFQANRYISKQVSTTVFNHVFYKATL